MRSNILFIVLVTSLLLLWLLLSPECIVLPQYFILYNIFKSSGAHEKYTALSRIDSFCIDINFSLILIDGHSSNIASISATLRLSCIGLIIPDTSLRLSLFTFILLLFKSSICVSASDALVADVYVHTKLNLVPVG